MKKLLAPAALATALIVLGCSSAEGTTDTTDPPVASGSTGIAPLTTPPADSGPVGTTDPGPASGDVGYAGFVSGLKAAGANVESAPSVNQPFFTYEQISITVDGQTVHIFEYGSDQEASDDAALVAPNGGSIGTSMMSWVAQPHFYRAGNLIVLYVGNDNGVTEVLETVVGAPFVTGGASMLPLPMGNEESSSGFDRLLTASDVAEIAGSAVSLQEKRDYKAMAGGEQIASMDNWFGSTYQTGRGIGLTYSVIDFVSAEAARAHYDSMLAEAAGMVPM